jgi:large subunit ribosomal protein L30
MATKPAKKKADKAAKTVTLRQIRSAARRPKDQGLTLRGLGLGKLNRTRTLKDTPALRGMIEKVRHLIEIVEESA